MSNREDIKEALKDAAQTGNRLYSDTLHLLQEDEREIERLVQDCTRIEEYLVKHKQENESLKGLAYINGKVDPRNTWLVLAEDYARQVGELKEENESLKALAYGDGDTHFSWRELAGQYKAERDKLRGALEKAKARFSEMKLACRETYAEIIEIGIIEINQTLNPSPKEKVCSECRGKGYFAITPDGVSCGACGGSGKILDCTPPAVPNHISTIPCPKCKEKEQEE